MKIMDRKFQRTDLVGWLCVIILLSFVIHAEFVVLRYIFFNGFFLSKFWYVFHLSIYHFLLALLIISYLRSLISDPGVVPYANESGILVNHEAEWTVCTKCNAFRPARAHHCRICNRCILKMDHHCVWINNCVGLWNQLYFLQFLFHSICFNAYILLLLTWNWLACEDLPAPHHKPVLIHSILSGSLAGIFGLFSAVIFSDQLNSILTDRTSVEQTINREKLTPTSSNQSSEKNTTLKELADFCGSKNVLWWIVPCQSNPRRLL